MGGHRRQVAEASPSLLWGLEPAGRIHGLAVLHNLEVQVAAGGVTGSAQLADALALGDLLAQRNADRLEVVVGGLQAAAVLDHDAVSAAADLPAGLNHLAAVGSS